MGSSLLFVEYLEGKEAAAKVMETVVFTATRALFIGGLGAVAALIGSAFLDLQRWFWILLGSAYVVLGVIYMAGKHWRMMRILGPKLNRVRTTRGAPVAGSARGAHAPGSVLDGGGLRGSRSCARARKARSTRTSRAATPRTW